MRALAVGCAVLLALACGKQGSRDTKVGYWGGSPPDPNVQLPSLPSPAPAQASTPEGAARELAGRVLAGGEGSLPALLAALQASGIAVADPDRSILIAPGSPAQGWGIERWEALALGLHPEAQTLIALPDLFAALAPDVPVGSADDAAAKLLADIVALASSDKPTHRFFALFVVELGRQGPQGQDLLGAVPPHDVVLGGVQAGLILRRLVADFQVLTTKLSARTALSRRALGRASGSAGSASNAPCRMTESESLIMDGSALGVTAGFDHLMEYLAEEGHLAGAAAFSKATGIANVILAYTKLFLYFSNLKVDFQLKGDPPLVRTKNTQAGESHDLTAEVSFDLGNQQLVNCFRIMMNMAGMDLSLPNSGALAGSPTEWIGLDGFGASSTRIVQFHGDPEHGRTDEEGKAKIVVEGAPQNQTLPETSAPVMKQARVRFLVAPKAPGFSQDLMDAASGAAAGPVGLIGSVPAEIILRTRLFKPFDYRLDVKDWASAWKGKIVFTQSGDGKVETSDPDPLEPSTTTTTAHYDITAETTLTSVVLEVPPFPVPGVHDDDYFQFGVSTTATAAQNYHWHRKQTVICDTEGCTDPPHIEEFTYDDSVLGAESQNASGFVVLTLHPDGSYTLELSFPAPEMAGLWSATTPQSSDGGKLETDTFQVHLVLEIAGDGPNPTTLSGEVSKPVLRTISQLHSGGDPLQVETTEKVTWNFVKGAP